MKKIAAIALVIFSLLMSGCVEIVRVRNPYYGSVRATSGYRVSGAFLGLIPVEGVVRGGFTAGGPPIRGTISGYGVDRRRGMRYGHVHVHRSHRHR